MNVYTYKTAGGKDLIISYLNKLPEKESAEGFYILSKLEEEGVPFLKTLDIRQLGGKLWEIKFYQHNRMMYVILDKDNLYLVHVCKKQKGRAEKHELDKARKRIKQLVETEKGE
jgi:phage-related protein